MADWVSAAATGLAALGNLFTAGQSKSLTREGWRLQQAENQKNREYMSNEWTRQFELQNAYNDPSAQVQRLVNAGINPSEVFGSGTNTTAMSQGSPQASAGSSIPISSPLPIQYLGSQFVNDLSNAIRALSEADKNEALTPVEKKYKESLIEQVGTATQKEAAEKEAIDLQNQLTKIYGAQLKDKEVQKYDADIRKVDAEINVLIQQKDFVAAQKKVAEADELLKKSQKLFTDAQAREINTLLGTKLMKYRAEIRNLDASTTELGTRSDVNESMKSLNDATAYLRRLAGKKDRILFDDEVKARVEELGRAPWVTEQVKQALEKAIRENNYNSMDKILQWIESGTRSFDNVVPF